MSIDEMRKLVVSRCNGVDDLLFTVADKLREQEARLMEMDDLRREWKLEAHGLQRKVNEQEAALKVERERRETTKAVLEICQKNKASMEAALESLNDDLGTCHRKYEALRKTVVVQEAALQAADELAEIAQLNSVKGLPLDAAVKKYRAERGE